MFGKGLICGNLLSPNKTITEATPYAAYRASGSPAIRSCAATGLVSTIGGGYWSAQRRFRGTRFGSLSGSFETPVISPRCYRPEGQGSAGCGNRFDVQSHS